MLTNSDPQGNGVGRTEKTAKAILVITTILVLAPFASPTTFSFQAQGQKINNVILQSADGRGNDTCQLNETRENDTKFCWHTSEGTNALTLSQRQAESKKEEIENQVTGAVAGVKDTKKNKPENILLYILIAVTAGGLLVYQTTYTGKNRNAAGKHRAEASWLYQRIKSAHESADSVKYEEALQLYKQILKHLERQSRGKYSEKLEDETRKLYDKLLLTSKLRETHEAIDDNDHAKFKNNLTHIKKLYHSLNNKSELTEHTRENYTYFVKHLKNRKKDFEL